MTLDPVIIFIGICAGLSLGLIAWLVAKSMADVPEEDRTYLDRPPPLFRLIWWPTQWIAFHAGSLIPIAYRQKLLVKLRLAGLDYTVSPEQLIAQRLVMSMLMGLLAWWIASSFRLEGTFSFLLIGVGMGYLYAHSWFRDRVVARKNDLLKTLPFFLDIIVLCVEAGLNLTGAFQQAVQKGPPGTLRDEMTRLLRDMRAGKPRIDALRQFGERLNEPSITNLVSALIQGEQMGMNLGPILRAQAEQRRTERFVRAEKAAMEAPVKMLFPLIAFIFPCTFLVLGFPILMKFMQMGF